MELCIRDSVKAVVSCCSSKGVYLELETGESAYTVFDYLPVGTHVLCTVLKKSTERWLTLVVIDSVSYPQFHVA